MERNEKRRLPLEQAMDDDCDDDKAWVYASLIFALDHSMVFSTTDLSYL